MMWVVVGVVRMVWVRVVRVVRVQPDERDGRGARIGRGHSVRRHRGQCQHVLRRGQLLGQAPGLHGRSDPVRVGHLVVHGRRRLHGVRGEQTADGPDEVRGRCGGRRRQSVHHGGGCGCGRARLLVRLSGWLTVFPGHCSHHDPNPVPLMRRWVVGWDTSVGQWSVGRSVGRCCKCSQSAG